MLKPQLPIPQLDGPTSVCVRRKQPMPMIERRTTFPRGGYPDESDSDSHGNRALKIESVLEQGDITRKEVRDHWKETAIKVEVIQGEEDPLMVEDLLMAKAPLTIEAPLMMEAPLMEDPLMMKDPLMVEDLLIMEDPQEMEDHQEDLEDKDHQAHQDLLDQYAQY